MEDHAYLGKTSTYHYMRRKASHTMEYIDNILQMRSNGTAAWFVPTSRFVFDVGQSNLQWQDIPYFTYKRSKNVGIRVVNYLTQNGKYIFHDRYMELCEIYNARQLQTDRKQYTLNVVRTTSIILQLVRIYRFQNTYNISCSMRLFTKT